MTDYNNWQRNDYIGFIKNLKNNFGINYKKIKSQFK